MNVECGVFLQNSLLRFYRVQRSCEVVTVEQIAALAMPFEGSLTSPGSSCNDKCNEFTPTSVKAKAKLSNSLLLLFFL